MVQVSPLPNAKTIPFPLLNRLKYILFKVLFLPFPFIPRRFPHIGGKSLIELIVCLAIIAVTIYGALQSSLAGGQIASGLGALTVFLSIRNNSALSLVGLTYEKTTYWHRWAATLTLVVGLIHGVVATAKQGVYIAGVFLILLFACIGLTIALKPHLYQYFYMTHVVVTGMIIPVAFVHGANFFGSFLLLWGCDMLFRYYTTLKQVEATFTTISKDIIRITVPANKTLYYEPGQYYFLMMRVLTTYEYHPFFVASSVEDDETVFYAKVNGDWTEYMYKWISNDPENLTDSMKNQYERQEILALEGPYGCLSFDCFNESKNFHEVIVLIGGGIGVAPLFSLWKQFLYQRADESLMVQKVFFIWTVKDTETADRIYEYHCASVINNPTNNIRRVSTAAGGTVVPLLPGITGGEDEEEGNAAAIMPAPLPPKGIGSVLPSSTRLPTEEEAFIDYDFHISSCQSIAEMSQSFVYKSAPQYWHPQRPNWETLFEKIQKYSVKNGYHRVGVYVSGPSNLTHEVRDHCSASQFPNFPCCKPMSSSTSSTGGSNISAASSASPMSRMNVDTALPILPTPSSASSAASTPNSSSTSSTTTPFVYKLSFDCHEFSYKL